MAVLEVNIRKQEPEPQPQHPEIMEERQVDIGLFETLSYFKYGAMCID